MKLCKKNSCLQKSKKIFHIVRQQGKGGVISDGRGQEEELEEEDEIVELEQRLRAAKLPEHALKAAKKELKVHVGMDVRNMYKGKKIL